MKTRIAVWAFAGLLVAGFWGLYFAHADRTKPIEPLVNALARVTQPVAVAIVSHVHAPVSLYSFLGMNAATYALLGLIVEALRRKLHHSPN